MLTKKKQLSKKEIKEDTLVTSYYKAVKFFDDYKSKIYIYAAALVVVAAAVYWYMDNKAKNNEQANVELSRIMDLYDSGAYQEAIDGRAGTNVAGLKKIVEQYGSTENGEAAKIYLANSYNLLGKYDEAFKYYNDYSGSNKLFKATALAGKASYFESKNELEKAADSFKDAAHVSKENVNNPDYLLNSGIDYLKAGKKELALEQFNKIKEDYKNSLASRDVEQYLALAK
ncbi:MAG: tetratricopeptide repeat protein [Ignavibacteriales bacterium]